MYSASSKRLVQLVAGLGSALAPFMVASVIVATPSIGADFPAGVPLLNWVTAAFFIVADALLIPFGRVADIRGSKKVLTSGMAVYLVAQLTTPIVFSLVRAAGKRAMVVVGKEKLKQLAVAGSTDSYTCATRGDVDVVNETITLLPAGFDLLFVHLPQVDHTGHTSGWMSAEYAAQLEKTDEAVGRLISLLPPETTIILTADHGGQLKNHGSKDKLDMTIPWIIAGPRVAHRGLLTRPVRTLDTALTALAVLGVPGPANATGKLVAEAFEAQ